MPSSLVHPFTPTDATEFINVVRAKGSSLWDDTGKEYIDGMANLWLCQVGHGRQEIVDAVADQMAQVSGYNIFDPFTNPVADRLADKIAELSPFENAGVFLGCSGSEAIDTAIKLTRTHFQRCGQPQRQIVVRRTHGYHGTNVGGTSVQGIEANREAWGDLLPHVVEVPHDDIEAASRLFASNGEQIAAVISEPVQGAGGVHPPADGYLHGLRRLCDQHGALLIADEVICGFGRTGSWFGSQTYGVTPDLITFAKGVSSGYLPLSGVIIGDRVNDALRDAAFLLRHGYTYSGHPASCAAGLANLELIEREELVDRAPVMGQRITDGLAALVSDGLIAGFRGVGGIWAAELGRDAAPLRRPLLEQGAIMRPIRDVLALCPPLSTPDHQIDQLIDAMATVLEANPAPVADPVGP
jgi:adenosylmethionine-8-amino-7-oxononanoate aminotransferase